MKKRKLTNEEKFANVEKLLAEKKLNYNGRKLFEKVIKKVSTPKPRSVK